jgi:3-deoxy-D-arabino-heptulosonate 7-phosphate (DAHP) synthase class II
MDPADLVKLCEILNPENKPGRLTVIVRMGAEKLRQKLPFLIRAVRQAGCIVTWVSDPMHGNTIKAPSGIKTRPFNAILVRTLRSHHSVHSSLLACLLAFFLFQSWSERASFVFFCQEVSHEKNCLLHGGCMHRRK